MGKYLRISNRGTCPRAYLYVLGATTKRESFGDPSKGGWFGSGTKFGPVAASVLGIEVHFSSQDDKGPYFLTFGTSPLPVGRETVDLITHEFQGEPAYLTQISTKACMNWANPVGCDGMRAFRVLREYLRNAADEGDLRYDETSRLEPAESGRSCAYLTLTPEIEHMLKYSTRYFKYLSGITPVYEAPGLGQFHFKSEPCITRLFSLGTLAKCSDYPGESSMFDYSFDRKELMSEERTFDDLGGVYRELAKMFISLTDELIARGLIAAMYDGNANLEAMALGYVWDNEEIPAKGIWLDAWKAQCGEGAVISSDPYSDDFVRYSFCRPVVKLSQHYLKRFLKMCGVPEARELVPDGKTGYKIVPPTPEEKLRLDEARRLLCREWPEMAAIPVCLYEPLSEAMRVERGFAVYADNRPKAAYLQRYLLQHPRLLLKVLTHEFRHIRAKASDNVREFVAAADEDITRLLVTKYHPVIGGEPVKLMEPDAPPPPLPPKTVPGPPSVKLGAKPPAKKP